MADKKGIASMILERAKKAKEGGEIDEDQGEYGPDESFKEAAGEFLDYVKADDREGAAMALKDAIKLCLTEQEEY